MRGNKIMGVGETHLCLCLTLFFYLCMGSLQHGAWASPTSVENAPIKINHSGFFKEGDKYVIAELPAQRKISWAYMDEVNYGAELTWENLVEGTSIIHKPPQNPNYYPGCVATALGQTMLHLLKYRYPELKEYGKIISRKGYLPSIIGVENMNPLTERYEMLYVMQNRKNDKYYWDRMPDSLPKVGAGDKSVVVKDVRTYISPLLYDLSVFLAAEFKLQKKNSDGSYVNIKDTWVNPQKNLDTALKAFGFSDAIYFGFTAKALKIFQASEYEKMIKTAIETNIDHGHPVMYMDFGHSYVIEGYSKIFNDGLGRVKSKNWRRLKTYYLVNSVLGQPSEWQTEEGVRAELCGMLFNIFPERPVGFSDFGGIEILSGLVVKSEADADSKRYVRVSWGLPYKQEEYVDVEVNEKSGVYSAVVPSGKTITLVVLDENKEPDKSYGALLRNSGLSHNITSLGRFAVPGFVNVGNVYAADFFPPSTATSVTGLDTPPPALTAQGRTAKILTREDLLRIFTPQEPSAPVSNDLDRYAYRTVVVASDPELDATGLNAGQYIEDVVKAKAFVAAGGTLVATGRSSIFPAFMGGSAGPKFYQFSYLLQPYGGSKQTETTVVPREIIERMGGVRTFQMNSSLPRSQHSIIKTAGNAKIISTTSHLMQEYDSMWGTWNYNMYPVPNVIEYPIGDKGGKVIYISGELSENYGESTVNRMFVDAMLDSALRGDDDEYDVADALGGDYFSDPTRRPNAMNQTNLNMVVYQNGITVANKKIGTDQSFVFNISERLAPSVAPQIDSSGAPELMVSLYDPSGALVSTRTAIPGESSIAFAVQATRNNIAGDWKCVVEDVHGFDGERVVVLAVVDGKHEINLEELEEVASQFEEIDEDVPDVVGSARMIKQSKRVASVRSMQNGEKLYPRGIQSGVLYRQLGDGRIEVGSRSFTSAQKIRSASNSVLAEQISKVSFGPLVVSSDVKIWREDDDLVIEVAGVNDRVNLAEWFINGSVKEVSFVDGSMSAVDMREKAVAREPEIYFIPALTDTTIRGTDESDRLTGNGKNALLLGGKGDDFISTNGGTSVFYYRRGDGHDTIFARKNTAKDMSVLRFDKDILSSDVKVDRSNNDMIFTIGDGSITVKDSFFGEATQLDRVEFFNGEVWDVRDVAKRAAGKPILPRRVYMELPNTEKQKEANDDLSASAETKQSSSGCNALGGVWPLLLSAVLAVIFKKRQNQGVSPDSILK